MRRGARWYLEFVVVVAGNNNIVDLCDVSIYESLGCCDSLIPSRPFYIAVLQASVVVAYQSMDQ